MGANTSGIAKEVGSLNIRHRFTSLSFHSQMVLFLISSLRSLPTFLPFSLHIIINKVRKSYLVTLAHIIVVVEILPSKWPILS